jgi:hypothetical protein
MFYTPALMMHMRKDLHLHIRWVAVGLISCCLLTSCESRQPSSTNSGDSQGADAGNELTVYPIDRHPGLSSVDGSPSPSMMMGDKGVLSYDKGCLYMARDGGRIALVAPANAKFDGKIFTVRNIPFHLGQSVSFDGRLASPNEISRLNCKDAFKYIIMAP